jgi:hypothetical protein
MAKQLSEEEIREEATKRVKAKKKFYGDFGAWAVVNTILVVIWALSGRGYPWFLWPLGIWGVFVLSDFIRVFVWERKSDTSAIDREVEKLRRERR